VTRTVLVTGASSGIGLETALHLARLGFRVVGTARSEAKAEVLRKAAHDAEVEVEAAVLDITDAAACRGLVGRLELYGLVNNAGYMNVGAVEDVTPEEALRQLHALAVAPMHLASLAIPGMRIRGAGRIVNISSMAAHLDVPLMGWYEAAKRALNAVASALRVELAGSGIDVILVEPGAFRTCIWDKAMADLKGRRDGSLYAAAYERVLDKLPALKERVPEPSAVAEVVGRALTTGVPQRRYLCGGDASPLEAAAFLVPPSVKDRLGQAVLARLTR
jgi:short-subunit dehydrogenase